MPNLLTVHHLSCERGYQRLFTGLNFSLKPGAILRINGANGVGKTSLLRMIAGLSHVKNGNVQLLDFKFASWMYFKNSLYLGHSAAISTDLTALENLIFFVSLKQKCDKKSAQYALDKLGLKYYHNTLCYELSAGEKRRVLLASLILVHTPLWLLDEPFTSLDAQGVDLVENLINKHSKKGGCSVFTTHQKTNLNSTQTLTL